MVMLSLACRDSSVCWCFVEGFGMEAVFLLGVAFTRNTSVAIACLTIAVGVSGFAISGTSMKQLQPVRPL